MTHLTNDEMILAYYKEPGSSDHHLAECEICRAEMARLSSVLDRVRPAEVDEPAEGYEEQVWSRLQWRLRGEMKHSRSRTAGWMAAAAAVIIAFVAGLLWNRRHITAPEQVAGMTKSAAEPVRAATQQRERVLLVVVGDHFDQSERVLIELTNLTASGEVDITSERDRAEALLASNRIYRRSAAESGEASVATLLDELEPVLLQIAHSDSRVSADELRSIQKRVEAKGLVFKLRVVRAGVRATPETETRSTHESI